MNRRIEPKLITQRLLLIHDQVQSTHRLVGHEPQFGEATHRRQRLQHARQTNAKKYDQWQCPVDHRHSLRCRAEDVPAEQRHEGEHHQQRVQLLRITADHDRHLRCRKLRLVNRFHQRFCRRETVVGFLHHAPVHCRGQRVRQIGTYVDQ